MAADLGAPGGSSGRVAIAYSPPPGSGGSGLLVHQVLSALAEAGRDVHALGPRPVSGIAEPSAIWHDPPPTVTPWAARFTWLRWRSGELVMRHSRARGRWAASELPTIAPEVVYAFTEVALESLAWARSMGARTILDSPTGHIRHFHDVIHRESERWCGHRSAAHPTRAMVERVEEEYRLADRIRGGSRFVRASMVARGVQPDRIDIVPYSVDLGRFTLRPETPRPVGPLRVCFVGMIALHKGFAYLLRAARLAGPSLFALRLIGGSVDRDTRRLLKELSQGLEVIAGPVGDLLPELHRAELLVLPTLHDGFGLVAAEAMASGLPVIVTDQCGAADWVEPGTTGWIVKAGDENALAAALTEALEGRRDLPEMGRAARAAAARHSGTDERLRSWVFDEPRVTV